MRPFRQDITGLADTNGNASIPIKLPVTGEWHNVKVAVSLSGANFVPVEWALSISGSVATYSKGWRATLGPELVRDGETLTLAVSGVPAGIAIIGSATGLSGMPEEIMASYVPQPNTIAVDTLPAQLQLANGHLNIPGGTTTFIGAKVVVSGLLKYAIYLYQLKITMAASVADGTFSIFFTDSLGGNTFSFRAGGYTIDWDFAGFAMPAGLGVSWFQDSGLAKFCDVNCYFRYVAVQA